MQADLVLSTTVGGGLQPPETPGSTYWDVDGDGTNDFRLRHFTSRYESSTYHFALFNDANGGRLVVPAAAANNGILKLSSGFQVKAVMTGAKFHVNAQVLNKITFTGDIGEDASDGGWLMDDTGFFGFKFTNASGTHYGYGQMTIDSMLGEPGQGFKIDYAYYETTPNAPVTVGAVPEPSSIALLALGALGGGALARRRRVPG